jgi:hypothetical protein
LPAILATDGKVRTRWATDDAKVVSAGGEPKRLSLDGVWSLVLNIFHAVDVGRRLLALLGFEVGLKTVVMSYAKLRLFFQGPKNLVTGTNKTQIEKSCTTEK